MEVKSWTTTTKMAHPLYDVLSKIKEEFDQINTAVHQEEDELFVLENSLKEQEEESQLWTSKLPQLEMAVQLAESEATIDLMKKENLVRKIESMRIELAEAEEKLEQKEFNLQELAAHFESKQKELEDLYERNHAKHMEIPCFREYFEVSEQLAYLTETASQLSAELNELREEYAAATRKPENNVIMGEAAGQTMLIGTIGLGATPVPPPSNVGLGIPLNIQEFFAKLMEENQLLKARLERLEMSQASVHLVDNSGVAGANATGSGSAPSPFKNQETPVTEAPPVEMTQTAVPPPKNLIGGPQGLSQTNPTRSERPPLSQPNPTTRKFNFKSPVKEKRVGGGAVDSFGFSPAITSIPEETTNILMDTSSTGQTPGPMLFNFSPTPSVTNTPMSLPGGGGGELSFMDFGFNGSPAGGSFF